MDPLYLDYNATSPLAPSVKEWLARGDFFYANPSSQHLLGKAAKKEINIVSQFLKAQFDLSTHGLMFTSGATEAINTFCSNCSRQTLYVYSPIDHPCALEQIARFENSVPLVVNEDASLNLKESIKAIKRTNASDIFINYLWVNNEIGVVWPLEDAIELKKQTGARIHVDGVQAIGKLSEVKLRDELDFYTFSGHKFGALKGVGFSFLKTETKPMILGGGQQGGLRSGTENTQGIVSLKLALEDLNKKFDAKLQQEFINNLRNQVTRLLKGRGEVITSEKMNLNTIYFVLNEQRSDFALAMFDQGGLAISSGAACSSGSAKESHVLKALKKKHTMNGLRISVGPCLKEQEVVEIIKRFEQVLNSF